MPVVLRLNGFQVIIFLPPREHGPPHVHVRRAGGEATIGLSPVAVREVVGMRATDVVRAVGIVEDNLAQLRQAWRKYHG